MISREFWQAKIQAALERRSICWLAGVRRVGKTTLCQSLPQVTYYDCELPSVRQRIEDPEYFWSKHQNQLVVLDEIHRLTDPSGVLKIAADHFKTVRVIATGSSTLAARKKFKDTLTDRKQDVWMQPLLLSELQAGADFLWDHRLLHGGLPPAHVAAAPDDQFYIEWLDSFWAKDVQELFNIDRKTSFMKMAELLLRQSGQLFQATSFTGPCEISRQTVQNYLEILETTLFVLPLRPWDRGKTSEIIRMPKVYAFDTGFVCFARGLNHLRSDDRGLLLEHLVLQEMLSHYGKQAIWYWRDKQQHEIDFIVKIGRGDAVHAVECKWSRDAFDAGPLRIFRKDTPHGLNILTAANISRPSSRRVNGLEIIECPPGEIGSILKGYHHIHTGSSPDNPVEKS